MIVKNILINGVVNVDSSSSINNLILNDGVRVAKRCSLFGSEGNLLEIGKNSYVGMNTVINGFSARVVIGENVSIAQSVNIMADSGPNASLEMQAFFPMKKGPINIGNHCWIGANSIIMPNVDLGDFCVIAANSFVTCSFESYSVIGGNPARLIRKLK